MTPEEKREITNELIMGKAIVEAVQQAAQGQEVSDFIESFHPVRDVIDLVAGIKDLEELLIKEG